MNVQFKLKIYQHTKGMYWLAVKEIRPEKPDANFYCDVYHMENITKRRGSSIRKAINDNQGWIGIPNGKIYFNTPEQVTEFYENHIMPYIVARLLVKK